MKKSSTVKAASNKNLQQKLTIAAPYDSECPLAKSASNGTSRFRQYPFAPRSAYALRNGAICLEAFSGLCPRRAARFSLSSMVLARSPCRSKVVSSIDVAAHCLDLLTVLH